MYLDIGLEWVVVAFSFARKEIFNNIWKILFQVIQLLGRANLNSRG